MSKPKFTPWKRAKTTGANAGYYRDVIVIPRGTAPTKRVVESDFANVLRALAAAGVPVRATYPSNLRGAGNGGSIQIGSAILSFSRGRFSRLF